MSKVMRNIFSIWQQRLHLLILYLELVMLSLLTIAHTWTYQLRKSGEVRDRYRHTYCPLCFATQPANHPQQLSKIPFLSACPRSQACHSCKVHFSDAEEASHDDLPTQRTVCVPVGLYSAEGLNDTDP